MTYEMEIGEVRVEVTYRYSQPDFGFGLYDAVILGGSHAGIQDYGLSMKEAVLNVFRKAASNQ